MHVEMDKVERKRVPHLFIYVGKRKFPAVLAPSPGGQQLGSVRFLLTDKNLYTIQILKDKTFVDYNTMPFKRDFLMPASFWEMCLINNLQECSWKEIKGLEEQKVREEQEGEEWQIMS